MKVVHEPGESQLADIGTKPLPKARLQELVALWKFKDIADRKVAALSVEAVPFTTQRSSVSSFGVRVISTKFALLVQCVCVVLPNAQTLKMSKSP